MALKAWICDGKLIVDSSGRPILCEDYPCGSVVATGCGCDITSATATATLNINGVPFTFPLTLVTGVAPYFAWMYRYTGSFCGGAETIDIIVGCFDNGTISGVNAVVTVLAHNSPFADGWQMAVFAASATFVCSPFYWDSTAPLHPIGTNGSGTYCGVTFAGGVTTTPCHLTVVTP